MNAMTEQNKATIRRLYEAGLNGPDPEVIDQVYAPDVELHILGVPEDPYGPAPVHELFATIQKAGCQAVIEDLVADGDKVVARITLRPPHEGRILGVSPLEPNPASTRIDVFRLHRGRIVEQWGLSSG